MPDDRYHKQYKYYDSRRFSIVRYGDQKELHVVEHIHFHGWPGTSLPKQETMEEFLNIMHDAAIFVTDSHNEVTAADARHSLTCAPQRLLVHGKGGTGRTGTTIALINLFILMIKQRFAQDIKLSPFSVVRRLKE